MGYTRQPLATVTQRITPVERVRVGAHALAILLLLTVPALGACRAGAAGPAIHDIQPRAVSAGDLLLLSGRGFAPSDSVHVADRPAARVTWVNADLLTVVAPDGLPPGVHPVEVRSAGGQRVATMVQVRGQSPAPAVVAAPPTPAGGAAVPPPPAPAAGTSPGPAAVRTAVPAPAAQRSTTARAPSPAPPPVVVPSRDDDGDDKKDKDKKDDKDKDKDKTEQGGGRGNGRGR